MIQFSHLSIYGLVCVLDICHTKLIIISTSFIKTERNNNIKCIHTQQIQSKFNPHPPPPSLNPIVQPYRISIYIYVGSVKRPTGKKSIFNRLSKNYCIIRVCVCSYAWICELLQNFQQEVDVS